MRKYQLVSVLFIMVFLLLLVSGCVQEAAKAPENGEAPLEALTWEEIVQRAKETEEITFYTFTYRDLFADLARDFEEEYGIKVNVVLAEANPTYQKVMAEKKSPAGTIDVWFMQASQIGNAREAGLLTGSLDALVPNAQHLEQGAREYAEGVPVEGYALPLRLNQAVIAYDAAKVPEPPKSLAELEAWVEKPGQIYLLRPQPGWFRAGLRQLGNLLADRGRGTLSGRVR